MPGRNGLVRIRIAALSATLAAGCTPPLPCGTARVEAGPGGEAALLSTSRPEVRLQRGAESAVFLLDTGFRRSALGPAGQAAAQSAADEDFALAETRVEADFQPWVAAQAPGVLGAEVLGQLPLAFSPSEGRLSVGRAFPGVAPGSTPLRRHTVSACDDPGTAYTLQAEVEGRAVTWLLDTGAEHTVLRSGVATALAPGRARLAGVVLETAFAGVVRVEALRLSSVALGAGTLHQVVALSGPALDAELDRQSQWLSLAAGAPVKVDGLLGWSALREGTTAFQGPPGGPVSALAFSPYPSSPWPRAFVGVGVALAPEGTALRVVSVYTPSPAADAGIAVGDVVLTVDGQPAPGAPVPFAAPGEEVTLVLQRGNERLERTVAVVDLLPDAQAQ